MKYVTRSLQILLCLYALYLVKSALGINLSQRYTAWDFVKYPVHGFIENPITH
ncbi:hypothetical protein [Phormidesmis sp. 146-33]